MFMQRTLQLLPKDPPCRVFPEIFCARFLSTTQNYSDGGLATIAHKWVRCVRHRHASYPQNLRGPRSLISAAFLYAVIAV